MRVGYIGLGTLGGPIAQRIVASGFALSIFDISPAAMERWAAPAMQRAASTINVAHASEALCICVRTDTDVLDVVAGGAIFAALGSGGLFIIQSTIDPVLCRDLALQAAAYGVMVIDCGVSGGGPAAAEGKLSIYVGGDEGAVAQAKPLLDCLGSFRHLGPVGRGMEGKLLNNLISIANYGMSAHILDLGEHLGFDRGLLHEMFMAGSAQSFAMKVVPGFTTPERLENMRTLLGKDVEHCRRLADPDLRAMQALIPAAQSMIDLLAARQAQTGAHSGHD
jgi:3-hydroxyisobutyrate dehydrogenase